MDSRNERGQSLIELCLVIGALVLTMAALSEKWARLVNLEPARSQFEGVIE